MSLFIKVITLQLRYTTNDFHHLNLSVWSRLCITAENVNKCSLTLSHCVPVVVYAVHIRCIDKIWCRHRYRYCCLRKLQANSSSVRKPTYTTKMLYSETLMCRCVCCIHSIGFPFSQSHRSMYDIATSDDMPPIIPSLSFAHQPYIDVGRPLASYTTISSRSNKFLYGICVYIGTVIKPIHIHFTCGRETE